MDVVTKGELQITPDQILVISKTNAKTFHELVKERIKKTGYGLMEYVETLKFFDKVSKVISGDSQSKKPEEKDGDKEFKSMIRDEITKWGKEYTTPRGVKFELAETGSKYDFSKCDDPELIELENQAAEITVKLSARKDFLKTVPISGLDIITADGEAIKIYPPSKSSTSSYKATLPK